MNLEKYPQPLDQVVFRQCCELIDEILQDYRAVINQSYQGYLSHCKRVAACCLMLSKETVKKPCVKLRLLRLFMILVYGLHTLLIISNLRLRKCGNILYQMSC